MALFLGACGGGKDRSTTTDTGAAKPASASSPPIHVPAGPPPGHVVIKDVVKGKGAAVPPISRPAKVEIKTLYKTAEYKTGTVLEERWTGHPFDFEFKPGAVVPAWEKGIVGMKVGGRRELIVPSRMAYGTGARLFLVQLLSVKKISQGGGSGKAPESPESSRASQGQESAESGQAGAQPHELTIPKQTGPPPRRIKVIDLRKGTGATLAKGGSVDVRYFEVSYPEVADGPRSGLYGPSSFGLDETVKGWTVGLPGMKVGGRRELILPPNLVYPRWRPSWGYTPYVRIYVVELLGVKQPS